MPNNLQRSPDFQVGYARIEQYDQESQEAIRAIPAEARMQLCRFAVTVSTGANEHNIYPLEREVSQLVMDNLQLPYSGSASMPSMWVQSCQTRLDEEPEEVHEDAEESLEWHGIIRLEIGLGPQEEAVPAEMLAPQLDGLYSPRLRWMQVRPLRTFGI